MRLDTRIDRVARHTTRPSVRTVCSMCGGVGRVTVSVVGEGEPSPQPPGCPRCGEVYQILIIRKDGYEA